MDHSDTPQEDERRPYPRDPRFSVSADGRFFGITGVELRTQPSDKGYSTVRLRHPDGRKSTPRVHRAVLETFVGPCPPGMEACHNNGDRTDNRLENLRWDTHQANERDKVNHGTNGRSHLNSHCPQGHAYTRENTYHHPQGWRVCRICKRAGNREAMRRRQQQAA